MMDAARAKVQPLRVIAEGLSYAIGDRYLVRNVSCALEPGEVTAIVGPNGAGKSTLVALLAGDLHPRAGQVLFGDANLTTMTTTKRAQTRAVLPQHTTPMFSFSVRDVVAMGRFPWNSESARSTASHVNYALERLGISALADQPFSQLSGGEQALVGLARIMVQDTPVVLLDEPTAALDVKHQMMVGDVLTEFAAQGRTVSLIAHDLNMAARFASRVIVLHQGQLVVCDDTNRALAPDVLSRVYDVDLVTSPHPTNADRLLLTIR
jgi:iron complex transport system ATP-binding protein